jgi:cytochrome b561
VADTVPEAQPQPGAILRYNRGAAIIHWVTAVLLIMQVWIGWTFSDMPRGPDRTFVFQWHKTWGLLILALTLLRLYWRFRHKPPPFPTELPRWERLAATWNHRIFYFLLIALPLTGLAAVSGRGPLTELALGLWFPTLPGMAGDVGKAMGGLHETLVTVTLALIVLHVAAALKHQFVDRTRTAGRMPPFRAKDGSATVEVRSGDEVR